MSISPHPLLVVLLVLAPGFAPAQEETGLLRFPAVYGNQVVFTYAGDLFTVSRAGGIARRLTSDVGYEMFARFSPDGKSIAFTGAIRRQYRDLPHAGIGRCSGAAHHNRHARPR